MDISAKKRRKLDDFKISVNSTSNNRRKTHVYYRTVFEEMSCYII